MRPWRLLFGGFLVLCFILQAGAQVSVIGELSQDKDVRPGETYDGIITVRNDTDVPQDAKIYPTDYLFRFDGTNDYGSPGSHTRSNAKWVTFSPSYLTIPPLSTMTVNYTVTVPAAADGKPLVGTYWSMLMVEGIPKTSPEASGAKKKDEMGIMQTIRYGIQVASTITQTGAKKINFIDTKLITPEKGRRVLQVDIENTGEIGMRPEVYVELFDQQGVSRGKYFGTRNRLYPGTSVRQNIDLSAVQQGTYKALVVVDAGGEDIFGAQYTLKF